MAFSTIQGTNRHSCVLMSGRAPDRLSFFEDRRGCDLLGLLMVWLVFGCLPSQWVVSSSCGVHLSPIGMSSTVAGENPPYRVTSPPVVKVLCSILVAFSQSPPNSELGHDKIKPSLLQTFCGFYVIVASAQSCRCPFISVSLPLLLSLMLWGQNQFMATCKCPSSSQKKGFRFLRLLFGPHSNFVRCEFVLVFTFGPWPISFWAVSMIRGRHLLKLSIVQKKTKDTTVNMSPSDLPPPVF